MVTSSRFPRPRTLRSIMAVALGTVVCAAASAAPGSSLHDAWAAAAAGVFPEAHALFSQAGSEAVFPREAKLGQALTLLRLQPKTERRIASAADLLDQLIEEDSTDAVGVEARYFRARVEHVHRMPPRPRAAVQHYEELIRSHPKSALAGQAWVKLALIELYDPESARSPAETFTRFAEQAAEIESSSARRDLHLVLGEAALRLSLGETEALEQFVAASRLEPRLRPTRADTLVRIGELASALGRGETARSHYRLFLEEYPRDPRRLAVAQHLAALDAPTRSSTP